MTGFTISLSSAMGTGLDMEKVAAVIQAEAETLACVAALPVANEAKVLVHKKTGTLMRSIHIGGHADLTPDTQIHSDIYDYGDVSEPEIDEGGIAAVYVGTNLDYAAPLEFGGAGTFGEANRTAIAKYGGGTFRQAYPYMRPAFNDPRVQQKSLDDTTAAANLMLQKAIAEGRL